MPSPGHRRLFSVVTSLSAVPNDESTYGNWIEAKPHLELLRRDAQGQELVVYAASNHVFVHAVLVRNDLLAPLPRDHFLQWDGNPYSSPAGYDYREPNGGIEIVRGFKQLGRPILDGATPLVYCRNSHGLGEAALDVEILQEFVHVSELHRSRSGRDYQRRDENGDVRSFVSVTKMVDDPWTTLVTMDRSILDEYMAVRGMSIVRMFDFNLYDIKKFNGWPARTPERFRLESKFIGNRTVFDGYGGFTRGTQILEPQESHEDLQRAIRTRFSGRAEEPTEFRVLDLRHGRVTLVSTASDATTNYFEQKVGVPFEISPAFFRPEVLQKYKSDSDKYTVQNRLIRCRDTWELPYGVNDAHQVHAYIKDLRYIPAQERLYWKSFNVDPDGGISRRVWETDIEGKFVDPESLERVTHKLRDWRQRGVEWWHLNDDDLLDSVNVPWTTSRDDWAREFLNLARLLVDGFDMRYLRGVADERGITYDDSTRSLQLLQEIVEAQDRHSSGQDPKIDAIRTVQRVRSKTAAHRWGTEAKQLAEDAIETHDSFAAHFQHICERVADELEHIDGVLMDLPERATSSEGDVG